LSPFREGKESALWNGSIFQEDNLLKKADSHELCSSLLVYDQVQITGILRRGEASYTPDSDAGLIVWSRNAHSLGQIIEKASSHDGIFGQATFHC
jgi:hypothetical protein